MPGEKGSFEGDGEGSGWVRAAAEKRAREHVKAAIAKLELGGLTSAEIMLSAAEKGWKGLGELENQLRANPKLDLGEYDVGMFKRFDKFTLSTALAYLEGLESIGSPGVGIKGGE